MQRDLVPEKVWWLSATKAWTRQSHTSGLSGFTKTLPHYTAESLSKPVSARPHDASIRQQKYIFLISVLHAHWALVYNGSGKRVWGADHQCFVRRNSLASLKAKTTTSAWGAHYHTQLFVLVICSDVTLKDIRQILCMVFIFLKITANEFCL